MLEQREALAELGLAVEEFGGSTVLLTGYPVLLGVTFVVAVATVVGNLLADLFYAVVDPRVRIAE